MLTGKISKIVLFIIISCLFNQLTFGYVDVTFDSWTQWAGFMDDSNWKTYFPIFSTWESLPTLPEPFVNLPVYTGGLSLSVNINNSSIWYLGELYYSWWAFLQSTSSDFTFSAPFDFENWKLFYWEKYFCFYQGGIVFGGSYILTFLLPVNESQISCPDTYSGLPSMHINGSNPSTPPASCSDWIQNQDETGIDIGGVCWWSTAFSYSGYICNWQKTNVANSDFSSYYTIWNLSDYTVSSGGLQETYMWLDEIGKDYDYFEFNWVSSTEIFSGSLRGLTTYTTETSIMAKDSSIIDTQFWFNIKIESARDYNLRPINYVAMKALAWRSPWSAIFYDKQGQIIENRAFVLTSSGIAVAQAINKDRKAYKVSIVWLPYSQWFQFWGIKIWFREQVSSYTPYCGNEKWTCSVNESGNVCSPSWYNIPTYRINDMCRFDTLGTLDPPWICIPNISIEEAYASGSQIQDSTQSTIRSTIDDSLDTNIFSCQREWFSVFLCPIDIAGKIFSLIINFFKIIASYLSQWFEAGWTLRSPLSIIIPRTFATDYGKNTPPVPWFETNSSWVVNVDHTSYTGNNIIAKSILRAWDNTRASQGTFLSGVYHWLIYSLILVIIVLILVLIFKPL